MWGEEDGRSGVGDDEGKLAHEAVQLGEREEQAREAEEAGAPNEWVNQPKTKRINQHWSEASRRQTVDKRVKKEIKINNDRTSSKVDWSRSSDNRSGRIRSRDWNRIWFIHYGSFTKPIIGNQVVPILYYGICAIRSNGTICLDDGVYDPVHLLVRRTAEGRRRGWRGGNQEGKEPWGRGQRAWDKAGVEDNDKGEFEE